MCSNPGQSVTSQRVRMTIEGAVQGVGFRPFVYRTAQDLGLTGWVQNSPQGVIIEAEGDAAALSDLEQRLRRERPPLSSIHRIEVARVVPAGETDFEIRDSAADGSRSAIILPDIATCAQCQAEIFAPDNRRYLYPFTNCTHCGPRYSIILRLPYDRPSTTMRGFAMCPQCQTEYGDPRDRRFHAQPNACAACGPQLALWDTTGVVLAERHDAILAAANAIRQGRIVALKGLGGFHLIADAANPATVETLRERKHRDQKPLAVMCPTLEGVAKVCQLNEVEADLLASPEAPIVLVRRHRRPTVPIADAVAPHNPYLGVMLPYTPLHHILMRELGCPVVATSGNLSDEPMCIDEHDALSRLGGIADVLLVHDRPIHRHVDDSVCCTMLGEAMILRRARGFAPLPIAKGDGHTPVLAVGAHLKNTVAMTVGDGVVLSQHIGDLDTAPAIDVFAQTAQRLETLYDVHPRVVACDAHPDYESTRFAHRLGVRVETVQHHHAHIAACMTEHGLKGSVLGVAWDGTGFGPDRTVWGGEFLRCDRCDFDHVARLRHFRLPGGDRAAVEPRRSAIGLLYEMFGEDVRAMEHMAPVRSFGRDRVAIVLRAVSRRLNAPETSSMGRLFDAIASILDIGQHSAFEGQAAMGVEFAACTSGDQSSYPMWILDSGISSCPLVIDWEPMVRSILANQQQDIDVSHIAARFHNALVDVIIAMARRVGEQRVVLSGGCFQNRHLLEKTVTALAREGFCAYWHRQVPPNDGGIALGQAAVAVARAAQRREQATCA